MRIKKQKKIKKSQRKINLILYRIKNNIITYQMNNDKRKIEEENEKRRQEINYYQDENLKLLYSKKLRDKAEENDRKYEENKIIRENKSDKKIKRKPIIFENETIQKKKIEETKEKENSGYKPKRKGVIINTRFIEENIPSPNMLLKEARKEYAYPTEQASNINEKNKNENKETRENKEKPKKD